MLAKSAAQHAHVHPPSSALHGNHGFDLKSVSQQVNRVFPYNPHHHGIENKALAGPSYLSSSSSGSLFEKSKQVKLVSPSLMPKLGKAGSLQSRQAIMHSLVHTESWAIDLSWDIIARFGKQEAMLSEFFSDFVKVAHDEGRHFTLLSARLEELYSYYGALPVGYCALRS